MDKRDFIALILIIALILLIVASAYSLDRRDATELCQLTDNLENVSVHVGIYKCYARTEAGYWVRVHGVGTDGPD